VLSCKHSVVVLMPRVLPRDYVTPLSLVMRWVLRLLLRSLPLRKPLAIFVPLRNGLHMCGVRGDDANDCAHQVLRPQTRSVAASMLFARRLCDMTYVVVP